MVSKLIDKIQKTNAPIVVGLDPKLDFIPDRIKDKCFEEKGKNLEGAAEAFWQYNKEIVDSIYDIVPAVKPQIAMYEELGIPGLITYKKTVDYCTEKGGRKEGRHRFNISLIRSGTFGRSKNRGFYIPWL